MGDDASHDAGLIFDDDDTPPPNRRAAVIIGVSTSAGLAALTSAGPTARRLGKWLQQSSPGFDVTVITDDNGNKVTRSEIFRAICSYVDLPVRYELLLVHYIGHGLYQRRDNIWMLSDLPRDPAACVSVSQTLSDAQFCGIPNVVVISDACRSLPEDVILGDVSPTTIFPTLDTQNLETSCVDYFLATGRGTPAFEGEIDGSRQSFLSYAFREAYRNPDPDMLRSVRLVDREWLTVVPNRRLGSFLKATVTERLSATNPSKSQQVIPVVPSDDLVFVAPLDPKSRTELERQRPLAEQTRRPPTSFRTRSGTRKNWPMQQVPATEIEQILQQAMRNDWVGQDPRLRGAPPSGPAADTVPDFETQTGLTLTGTGIARAAATHWPVGGSWAEFAPEKATNDLSVLRLHPATAPVGELALELEDGRCLLLPMMQGYICHVAVDGDGTSDIAFVPGRSNWRSGIYADGREKSDRLRALATEAMDQHRFFVGSAKDAKQLADAIRMKKAVNPILGLLAAQAYSEASMPERVRSVSKYMNGDIQADLFDVRLLANRFWMENEKYPVIPRCPMLTQNWALLASRRAPLPEPVAQLRPFLTDALWTTFAPGAASILFDAIDKGTL